MAQHKDDRLRQLGGEHVDALAAGATLLGSGGGGAVALGELLLGAVLRDRPVDVRLASELSPGGWVVHVGVVGGPDVLAERLINPADVALAARTVANHLDGDLAAVGVIEIGGLNAMIGVLAAAQLDVPVVDGDLMGRAFPSINKTTLAVRGQEPAPLALVNPSGDTVLITKSTPHMAESLMASCVAAMGGAASLALYPTAAAVLDTYGVRGSLSSCVALGSAYLEARSGNAGALVQRLGGRLLFEGRVDEIRPRMGSAPGAVILTEYGDPTATRIDYLEELLAVTRDGVTVACTPEVIVALHSSNLAPVRSDQIRVGQALTLFALPALHEWPPEAATVVGPAGFGLELEISR